MGVFDDWFREKRKYRHRREGYEPKYKWCKECEQVKPISEFYKRKENWDGYFHSCKACMDKRTNRNNHKKQAIRKREKLMEAGATKVCNKCGVEKPLEEFPKNSKKKDGTGNICTECIAKQREATKQKKLERAEQERLYLIEREMLLRSGRNNFFNFCEILAPEFFKPDRWHLWLLCNTLQALYERHLTKNYFWKLCTMPHIPKWVAEGIDWDRLHDGKPYTKLMINMSPRSGKSRSLTMFADWILGKSHDNRIITVSYNTDLAANMSRYVRDGIAQQKNMPTDITFSDFFPDCRISKGNSGFMKWALEGQFFNYLGTGMEGTITGVGANCLLEGTLVLTNKGEVPIEQICSNKDGYLLPSLCLKNGIIEYKEILATREVDCDEILIIKTEFGREIACTKEHRFFDGTGFREAGTFRTGDCFYAITQQEKQNLCDLWEAQGWQRNNLPRLLYRVEKTADKASVPLLQERILQTDGRISQSDEKKYQWQDILFARMCEPCSRVSNDLYCLWKEGKGSQEVLLKEVRINPHTSNREIENVERQDLSNVRNEIQTAQQPECVLFKGMCKQGSFSENDRQGKSTLCRRTQLRSNLLKSKEGSNKQGQASLLDLRERGEEDSNPLEGQGVATHESDCSPHRPEHSQQQQRQFDNCMCNLPPEYTSSIRADRIVSIERVSSGKHKCYDLQVKDNENFFANSILTHNCLIVDDVIKNANEAYNERVLEDIWNWYTGTFMSRAEHGGDGAIEIINFTRWSTKDLCGRILDSPMGDEWANLIIPVEHEGEIYCPEILPQDAFERLREGMDTNIFEANYYQKPLDVEGRLFTEMKTYDVLPEGTESVIAYCDTADEGDDYLACVVGKVKDGEGYITDIYFTQDNMQITEPATADLLVRNGVTNAKIESNNGGKGFARNVERLIWEKYHTKQVNITWFHQTENKMARILTGSTFVINHVYFPEKWDKKWPEFYKAVMGFTKDGKNKHDDGVEALVEWGKMITGDGSVNSYIEWMKRMQEGRA